MTANLLAPAPGRRLGLEDATRAGTGTPLQVGFDELGVPLSEVSFVVVDLETTGGSPTQCEITEIGAVKVRGGEVLGEFQTLVDPGGPVPPMITVLTGITDAMLVGAPRIGEVLPSFLEFAGFGPTTVLVAHNARFDVGFLRAAATRLDLTWPSPAVVDTVALARTVVTKDEAPNHKLGTLAALFGATTSPDHRALHDARATVDVLHALLGRLAPLGATHLEDLATIADPVPHGRRRKSTLADTLPTGPGVYQFLGPGREVLYVGKAVNLRRRVRSYFTAGEKRKRIGEMLDLTQDVHVIPCATDLEASVRELRLIAELDPPYNRRSRRPHKRPWVRLTDEPFPRLSIVRSVPAERGTDALGPFSSRAAAQSALEALEEAFALRRCTQRLPVVPNPEARACALAEMGHCGAPCTGGQSVETYSGIVRAARGGLAAAAGPVVAALRTRIGTLAAQQRYEEAATERDRLRAFLVAARRSQRLRPLWRSPQLVAARRLEDGGWEVVLVRHGRLAGTCTVPRGVDPMPAIDSLVATGEEVAPPAAALGAATAEETELLADWIENPATRLVQHDPGEEPFAWPLDGAAKYPLPPTA
ncbi:DEDD exonuclease domain-containing protein [Georgenia sp. H159]|uniref:DEDD exonuclease domain-containing protein n=1 Tax=Georgenia sp. H159 TaxID=3076115 RepID=UPI002D79113D|nr:DEDD exonuclease domain-containing protein [Georgenia sp. H159]